MDYREQIKEKGLKIGWIAKKLGISPTLLSFYLSGDRPIPDFRDKQLKEILT